MKGLRGFAAIAMATLSLGAMATTSATADDFTAEKYPVTLTGVNETFVTDQFVTTAGAFECLRSLYTGTISGPTTSLSVEPNYPASAPESPHNCKGVGFGKAVDVNGCTYLLNIGTGTAGDIDIVCPPGKEMTLTEGTTNPGLMCIVHIPPQNDVAGTVTYSNIGIGATREVTVNAELSGIDYTHTAGTSLGKCTSGSGKNGSIKFKAAFTGENDPAPFKEHIGFFVN